VLPLGIKNNAATARLHFRNWISLDVFTAFERIEEKNCPSGRRKANKKRPLRKEVNFKIIVA
jgi:hypothetical protein